MRCNKPVRRMIWHNRLSIISITVRAVDMPNDIPSNFPIHPLPRPSSKIVQGTVCVPQRVFVCVCVCVWKCVFVCVSMRVCVSETGRKYHMQCWVRIIARKSMPLNVNERAPKQKMRDCVRGQQEGKEQRREVRILHTEVVFEPRPVPPFL